MKTGHVLALDLCPYRVERTAKYIRIEHGVLQDRPDNRVQTTGNRFSEDYCCTKVGDHWCWVEYDDEWLTFSPMSGHTTPPYEVLVEWFQQNYDRIESIGWEMLEEP